MRNKFTFALVATAMLLVAGCRQDMHDAPRYEAYEASASFPDGRASRHLALLKVVPEKAEFWDAPNSRTVRLLALAASAVARTPIGQADHAVLTDLSAPAPAGGATFR